MIASAADAPAFLVMRGLNAGKQVPEGLVARLAKLAESEALPASERANAFLAMGRCLSKQGRHVEAFDLLGPRRGHCSKSNTTAPRNFASRISRPAAFMPRN